MGVRKWDAEPRITPSPGARIVLLAVLLILLPGVFLGVLGFRSIAARAEGLSANYAITASLVRDRLEAELGRREGSVSAGAETFLAEAHPADELKEWLRNVSAEATWLEGPFLVHRHGGVITSRVSAGWPLGLPGPAEANPRFAALLREAEAAEFAREDLRLAARLYREASAVATGPSQRCLALARAGRSLFKDGRHREGIEAYRAVVRLGPEVPSVTGAPCQALALERIAAGHDQLGDTAEAVQARLELASRVVTDSWDLDGQYALYLELATAEVEEGARHREEAARLADAISEVAWIREIGPRLRLLGQRPGDVSAPVLHLSVERDGVAQELAYRPITRGDVVGFGYRLSVEGARNSVLPRLLETVDIGPNLSIGLLDEQRRWLGEGPQAIVGEAGVVSPDLVLAEANLGSSLPGWTVAVVDERGRSAARIVARENLAYGLLMSALVLVLAAGVGYTVRAASHEVELSRLRSDFVANVTHELKTPLSLIRMYGETLESGLVSDAQDRREFLSIIRRESERLTHLINNVLDFGKIDSGSKEYAFVTEDIGAVVRESVEAYRPFFERMGTRVEIDVPPGPIYARLDRDAIAQSLVNLLHNALKYGGDGGRVRVAVTCEQGEVCVSVVDRGVGIPSDQIDRIFEKYYQVNRAESAMAAGSGLGLTIVRHAIEGHGGRVEVRSTPGRGSTFTLRLPLAPTAPPAALIGEAE